MAQSIYRVNLNGSEHLLRLSEEAAKRYPGAQRVDSNDAPDDDGTAAVEHKARRPRKQPGGAR